jgi:hypothetical protein
VAAGKSNALVVFRFSATIDGDTAALPRMHEAVDAHCPVLDSTRNATPVTTSLEIASPRTRVVK